MRVATNVTVVTIGFLMAGAGAMLAAEPSGVVLWSDENMVTYVERQMDTLAAPPVLRDDPDLEAGFPVNVYHSGGNYHAGQAIHTLIMNLDGDPELEIIATALAMGPVYAWNHDGSLVAGWPVAGSGAGYAGEGPLGPTCSRTLVVGYWGGEIAVYDSSGVVQPGWPISASNYVATPPSVAQVANGFREEIFVEEEDWGLHGYESDGTALSGWPVSGMGGQERHTCAIGDIDGDVEREIITCSGATTPGVYMHAYNPDGSEVSGFPVNIEPAGSGAADAFPVIGDVDGDLDPEIVVANKRNEVRVYAGDGMLEAVLPYAGTILYSTAVALGDLDGDLVPEIVVQSNDFLTVVRADSTFYPGWPVGLGSSLWLGNSSPVIGDVDGDGDQDIVITVQQAGSGTSGELRAYDSDGTMLAQFPKALSIGAGAVPAIADLDLDGRNEIIVTGSYWNGSSGDYPKCWVFDLQGSTYGGVEWGQFMHDPWHTGYYGGFPTGVAEGETWRETESREVLVAPNPGRTEFRFDCGVTNHRNAEIRIYSIEGRLIRVLDSDSNYIWDTTDADGMEVAPGVYYLCSGSARGRVVVVR